MQASGLDYRLNVRRDTIADDVHSATIFETEATLNELEPKLVAGSHSFTLEELRWMYEEANDLRSIAQHNHDYDGCMKEKGSINSLNNLCQKIAAALRVLESAAPSQRDFTPGPWLFKDTARQQLHVWSEEHGDICRISRNGQIEYKENAELIRKAPNMFAALEKIRHEMKHGTNNPKVILNLVDSGLNPE